MERNKYEEIRKELFELACNTSKVKGNDYTRGSEDVLANFKNVANKLNLDPKQVLLVYMDKHQDAIANYIKSNGQSESEPIKMRIVDNINYLFLLYGLIEEQKDKIIEENRENFFSKSKGQKATTMDRPKTINILPDSDRKGYKVYVYGSERSGYTVVGTGESVNPVCVRSQESGEIEYMEGDLTGRGEYRKGTNATCGI
jgi:ABC-type antimicrobial peptide transport system permease subunit